MGLSVVACSNSSNENVHTHEFLEVVVEPTCTEQGFTIFTCKNCDYTYKDKYVAATGHSLKDTVIQPTCTEQGYTLHECKNCDYSYKDQYTDPKGHTFSNNWTTSDTHHWHASTCGHNVTSGYELHDFETEVIEPTRLSYGYTIYTCKVCEYTKQDDFVDPLPPSIVEFVSYNEDTEKIEINIDEFYKEYGDTEVGTTILYNAILEALVRYDYDELSEARAELPTTQEIQNNASQMLNIQKQTATEQAALNGTSFEEEMNKIFLSFNVDSLDSLEQLFVYQLEKEAINDSYVENNINRLTEEFIGVDSSWNNIDQGTNFDSLFPYHVQHILVKLNGDSSDYARMQISEDEAKKLWTVVRMLIDGNYSYEQVARNYSDDVSASEFGDIGIMTTQTSFVNEFKLGIYAYDALLSGVNYLCDENLEIYKAFGIDDMSEIVVGVRPDSDNNYVEIKEKVMNSVGVQMIENLQTGITGYGDEHQQYQGIATVPYDVFRKIGQYAEEDTSSDYGSASFFPRNILFNQFLNFNSPFVITNEDIVNLDVEGRVETEIHDFDYGDLVIKNSNFKYDLVPYLHKGVLATRNNDVVIGVKSDYGIHFIVLTKSVFKNTNQLSTFERNGEQVNKSEISLQDYYSTKLPEALEYPSYINFKNTSDQSYYEDRASTIKNILSGKDPSNIYDAAFDYRIFEFLMDEIGDRIHFFDEVDGESQTLRNIQKRIENIRIKSKLTNEENINSSWAEYMQQLKAQNHIRNDFSDSIIPNKAIFDWIIANSKPGDDDPRNPGSKLTNDQIRDARDCFEYGGIYYEK